MSTTATPTGRRRYRLTPAGMASLRRAARRTRPWQSSTGPRTAEGKARSSQNARKHGQRSAEATAARREMAALMLALREGERMVARLERTRAECITGAGGGASVMAWLERFARDIEAAAGVLGHAGGSGSERQRITM